jgi:DNA-directed RNA polymerase subunit alpha
MEPHVYTNWRSLIKPKRVERDSRSTERYGKFVARPLERGFGVTIGNSLRRILLSSLQGAAITDVKLEGVLHEFASIPGIVEDVTNIILNLKQVVLKTSSLENIRGSIEKVGDPGQVTIVTVGDIKFEDDLTEALNKDTPICTITNGGRFSAEINAKMGKGYVPAAFNKSDPQELGVISIDSIHSPIRKVKYTVTDARVGQRTDYDKLILEVWTNGAVAPEDAVAYAAKILREQLLIFLNFSEEDEPVEESSTEAAQEINENLFRRVDELELSVRSANCLQNAGIEYIWQLVEKSEAEMLKTKNFGRKSLNEIKELLGDLSLALGTKLGPNFPRNR